MRSRRIRVKVEPGAFASERTVSFEAGGRQYALVVDEQDICNGTLEVYLVAESPDRREAVIDLPRDTFTSGSRIRIPADALLPA